ncbi:MAG: hypothetical protein ACD_62C00583G0001 [uncultured bacterium]|nr:MAG: hypothetical protein ACD_62C00583G0001 [uncultured bacterium]
MYAVLHHAAFFFQAHNDFVFNGSIFRKGQQSFEVVWVHLTGFYLNSGHFVIQDKIDLLIGRGPPESDFEVWLLVGFVSHEFHQNVLFEGFSKLERALFGLTLSKIIGDPHIKKVEFFCFNHATVFRFYPGCHTEPQISVF